MHYYIQVDYSYNVLECSLKVQGLREMCEGLNGVNR